MYMIHVAVDVIHVDALGAGVFPDVVEDVVSRRFFQERFAACAPWVSLPAMFRCMPGSKMALGLSAVAMVAVHGLKKIPFVGDLLAAGAGLVLFIMLSRMVGMIAAQHRKALSELH